MQSYGMCHSWCDATKAFGRQLLQVKHEQPVKIWPMAAFLMNHHEELTKTLIKDFINHDAVIIVEKSSNFEENKYIIEKEIIDELGWM